MKLIYLSHLIDYQNGKYYVDFVIENDHGKLLTCQKECKDSKEADAVYKELEEIRDHDNPSNAVIVTLDTLEQLS